MTGFDWATGFARAKGQGPGPFMAFLAAALVAYAVLWPTGGADDEATLEDQPTDMADIQVIAELGEACDRYRRSTIGLDTAADRSSFDLLDSRDLDRLLLMHQVLARDVGAIADSSDVDQTVHTFAVRLADDVEDVLARKRRGEASEEVEARLRSLVSVVEQQPQTELPTVDAACLGLDS